MLRRIFPKQFDNDYRGYRLAIWLLIPVVLAKLAMGTNSLVNTRLVAMSADGIPLDSYSAGAEQAVIALFALWGLSNLLIGLQGVLALVRYRAMIPFTYLLFLLQYAGSKTITIVHPIARSGATTYGSVPLGQTFLLAVLALTVLGFVLSLLNRRAD